MRLTTTHAEGTRRSLGNRLVLGFAGIMMAVALSVGFAGSASAMSTTTANLPHSKADCKHGGWRDFTDNHGKRLFKNQGQCIALVNHMPGGGYGNTTINIDIDINIDVTIIGNGNTIIIGIPPM